MRNRLMRGLALGAASTMLAGGAALTVAGTASAAPTAPSVPSPDHPRPGHHNNHHCFWQQGHWTKVWHHGFWDKWGNWHHGYWVKFWVPGHWVCAHR